MADPRWPEAHDPRAELLPDLDGPAVLVFLSSRRFSVLRPEAARALRDRIDAALAEIAPEQLPLLAESA